MKSTLLLLFICSLTLPAFCQMVPAEGDEISFKSSIDD
ncbi:MAG: hypothetical protein JWO06_1897, partial [Bacteroidota bacterium]|nr:hypothetical protein [Bacteroidota bacterium]